MFVLITNIGPNCATTLTLSSPEYSYILFSPPLSTPTTPHNKGDLTDND